MRIMSINIILVPRNNVHKYEASEYDRQFNILALQILFKAESQKLTKYHSSVTHLMEVFPLVNWGRNAGFQLNLMAFQKGHLLCMAINLKQHKFNMSANT